VSSAATLLSDKRGQFAYFDTQLGHPHWRGARVLDFGGNCGTLLADADGAIEPSRYWSVDVYRDAIEAGARRFPDAHFVHYDRWQHPYNPRGVRGAPPPVLGQRFDFILGYSVFTMLDEEEIVELATALRAQLADGGVLAFTFIDPHHRQLRHGRMLSNLEWRLEVAAASGIPVESAAGDVPPDVGCCYLIEQRWLSPSPRYSFETFLTASRMRALLPGCETVPPTADVRQHCCVIRG
jgi:hypothetical protein